MNNPIDPGNIENAETPVPVVQLTLTGLLAAGVLLIHLFGKGKGSGRAF